MTDMNPVDPAPVPATPTPAKAPVPVATEPAPRRSRALGRFALILGLLAFIGDIGVLIFAIVQIASFAQTLDVQHGLAALAGFAALAFIVFWAGIVVGGLAVLFGLIAAISNRGRAAGIGGLIFGLLVLISHISVGLAILGGGNAITNLGS